MSLSRASTRGSYSRIEGVTPPSYTAVLGHRLAAPPDAPPVLRRPRRFSPAIAARGDLEHATASPVSGDSSGDPQSSCHETLDLRSERG